MAASRRVVLPSARRGADANATKRTAWETMSVVVVPSQRRSPGTSMQLGSRSQVLPGGLPGDERGAAAATTRLGRSVRLSRRLPKRKSNGLEPRRLRTPPQGFQDDFAQLQRSAEVTSGAPQGAWGNIASTAADSSPSAALANTLRLQRGGGGGGSGAAAAGSKYSPSGELCADDTDLPEEPRGSWSRTTRLSLRATAGATFAILRTKSKEDQRTFIEPLPGLSHARQLRSTLSLNNDLQELSTALSQQPASPNTTPWPLGQHIAGGAKAFGETMASLAGKAKTGMTLVEEMKRGKAGTPSYDAEEGVESVPPGFSSEPATEQKGRNKFQKAMRRQIVLRRTSLQKKVETQKTMDLAFATQSTPRSSTVSTFAASGGALNKAALTPTSGDEVFANARGACGASQSQSKTDGRSGKKGNAAAPHKSKSAGLDPDSNEEDFNRPGGELARSPVRNLSLWRLGIQLNIPVDELKAALALFDLYSVDSMLSKVAFGKVLCRLTGVRMEDELPDGLANESWGVADEDFSGAIDFVEFARWYAAHGFSEEVLLTEEQRIVRHVARNNGLALAEVERIKSHFDTFDTDGSGQIDAEEFRNLLCQLIRVPGHLELPASRVRQFWQETDIDGSGEVEFEEFLLFYRRYFDITGQVEACPFEQFYRAIRPVKVRQW